MNPERKKCRLSSCDLSALPYCECCHEHATRRELVTAVTYLDRDKRHLQAELDDLNAYINGELGE